MHVLKLLLAATLTTASTLLPRDASTVNSDITGIDIAVRNLTSKVSAYNGGITPSDPIFTASIAVHNINRIGFHDALSSSRFTSAESKKIVNNVNKSVGVSIPAGLKVLESKKDLFDEAQITPVIGTFVNLLKSDHETFSAAVGKLLSVDQAVPGAAAAGKIDAALQEASLFFAVPGVP